MPTKPKPLNILLSIIITLIATYFFTLGLLSLIHHISQLKSAPGAYIRVLHLSVAMTILGLLLLTRFGKLYNLFFRRSRGIREPVLIDFPFQEGLWMAFNSPWSKVPSHGTIQLGQEYAIDLSIPEDQKRSTGMARVDSFPSYGKTIQAPCDGVIVKISNWMIESPVFTGILILVFFPLQLIRGVLPLPFTVGNYCTIYNKEEDYYLTIAHIKRNSFQVKKGDHVTRGDIIAQCGNTGNTTEPHIHLQCHTKKYLRISQGVPFEFMHNNTIYTPKNFETIGEEKISIQ